MIMWCERYSNASPKPDFFLFSLFIFSFISQLIWIRLGWNFHRWFSIQERVNWCTIDPFSLYFCTSQHSYPVILIFMWSQMQWTLVIKNIDITCSNLPYFKPSSRGAYRHDPFSIIFEEHRLDSTRTDIRKALFIS